MTVTFGTPVNLGGNTWSVTWSSDQGSPSYTVYVNGEIYAENTTAESITISAEPGESPVVEVVDDGSTPATAFPGRLTLQWERVDDADYYRIDEYSGGDWTERARIRERGLQYYAWRTRWLEDETTHQFRIVAVGENGNEATARSFSVLMVRHPTPPDVTLSYDSGTGDLTVS